MKRETILIRSQYINKPQEFRERPSFFFVDVPLEDKEMWMIEVFDSLGPLVTEVIKTETGETPWY